MVYGHNLHMVVVVMAVVVVRCTKMFEKCSYRTKKYAFNFWTPREFLNVFSAKTSHKKYFVSISNAPKFDHYIEMT